uniref:Uncharacterized protein n=1 Tax=Nicotiana tabacum TaxID=4097 RepID=A0A1S4BJ25_TOBAC|nr:PREDICTED: uncharacterized protein LOC107808819 [Nicotiana tabacum]
MFSKVPDEWEVEASTKGLNSLHSDASRKLKESVLEFQATTWADVYYRYESKIRIEDDQLSSTLMVMEIKDFSHRIDFISNRREDRGRSSNALREKESSGSRDLVLAMRNIKERTGDCRHLREEVAALLKNGHLREFLSDQAKGNYGRNQDVVELAKPVARSTCLMINMIFGGDEINGVKFLSAKKTKIFVNHGKRMRETSEGDEITFTEEDDDGLILPQNDALVISLNVLDFKTKRVLVDLGSSTNIIKWRVLEQAKLT